MTNRFGEPETPEVQPFGDNDKCNHDDQPAKFAIPNRTKALLSPTDRISILSIIAQLELERSRHMAALNSGGRNFGTDYDAAVEEAARRLGGRDKLDQLKNQIRNMQKKHYPDRSDDEVLIVEEWTLVDGTKQRVEYLLNAIDAHSNDWNIAYRMAFLNDFIVKWKPTAKQIAHLNEQIHFYKKLLLESHGISSAIKSEGNT